MDDLDRAKELEMQHRNIALKNTQNRHQPKQQFDEFERVICIDCAAVIPTARLMAQPKAARCVGCKEALEAKQKQYRGH